MKVNKLVYSFAKDNQNPVPRVLSIEMWQVFSPKIYGLSKIHKYNVPLRPIVSFTGALTYYLSKFLVDILSPLLTFEFLVHNARNFVKFINDFQSFDDKCLVLFDVASLLTSIPLSEVLVIIPDLLSSDILLHEHAKLTINDVLSSLLCLNPLFLHLIILCIDKFLVLLWNLVLHLF